MPKTYGPLDLVEKFPASSVLKLAKHQFGYNPFTCRMIYDAQIDYYGSEQRTMKLTATAIAQLMNRGFIVRHPEKSDDKLTMYRVKKNSPQRKRYTKKISYKDIFELIKNQFAGQSFTHKEISKSIEGRPDVRFQFKTLLKHDLIKVVRRDFRGKHYKLKIVEDTQETPDQKDNDQAPQPDQADQADQAPQIDNVTPINQAISEGETVEIDKPIEVRKNQIIDREVLKTLDIPLDLIGEAIVMKITALRRKIDDLETAELTYKRQLDEMQKNAHTQSRIIQSLNDKVTYLSKEAPRHSKTTIANLGEVARISTLKRK